jgi:hypothetical protein
VTDDVDTPATERPAADVVPDAEPAAETEPAADAEPVRARRRRGWISLHALAFALVLASGALVVVASLNKLDEDALGTLRVSWWISGAAIVVAIASVVAPRRRS